MAIKKSDLYSSLWASCNELRGGMDASQYKDYVLFMLFIKYITDKYGDSGDFAPPVIIPKGASFKDMIALKGKSDIGDKINTQIIQPLINANARLARSDFPDFNDPNKLGEGKDMVEKLSNLVGIFQKPELDFSNNRAEHDDILGDAYEYLMRHFASESGKSKGQFYTPSEVSRIIAKVIGISPENTKASTTAYDPTCGSGSLLLKVAAEAGKHITLEGQEKDVTTAGLARMNMILHDFPTANILSGNTLAAPKFKDGEQLRTYDYVVANPPFSDKSWSTGLTPSNDPYQRFAWGEPPAKQGDYAYLLHIIRSMKSNGRRERCWLGKINSSLLGWHIAPKELTQELGWYEAGKIHQALTGDMVRSKSEVIIANLLHERDIEFRYEKPLYAPDGSMYLPDFTLIWAGEEWYWEHLGRLDLPKYQEKWGKKEKWYHRHFPGRLLLTREGKDLSAQSDAVVRQLTGS